MNAEDLPFALWDLFPDAPADEARMLQQEFAGLWQMAAVLDADPEDADRRLERATLLLRYRRVEQARADALAVRLLDPRDPRPYEMLVSVELLEGHGDAARAWADQLVSFHPGQWWGHYLRLRVGAVTEQYRWQEDLSADRMAELRPDDPDTWRLVALADLARGRTGRGRRMAERTLAQFPDDLDAAVLLLGLERTRRTGVGAITVAALVAATHDEAGPKQEARRLLRRILGRLTAELTVIGALLWWAVILGAARDRDGATVLFAFGAGALIWWWRKRGRWIRRPLRVCDWAARATPVLFVALVCSIVVVLFPVLSAFGRAGGS